MNPKLRALAVVVTLAGAGCSEADCVTELCTPFPTDSAVDALVDATDDSAVDASRDGGACDVWARLDACEGACPDPLSLTFDIAPLVTASGPGLADPVALAFDPTEPARALVASSDGMVAEVRARGAELRFGAAWDLGIGLGIVSSISIAPDGTWAVVSAIDDRCLPGTLYFVDLDAAPGSVLRTLDVGVWPDHVAISPDGRHVVSADEDQREPCKPSERRGGTISVIDVSAGVASATVAQTIAVDHALDSEPEGLHIGEGGVVAVSVQETDELLLFDLDDVPAASTRVVAMPSNSRPDGVFVDEALGFVAVALERSDEIAIVSIETGDVVHRRDIVAERDVPDEYNRDARDVVEVHEPEEPAFFRYRETPFLAVTVQESHAVLVYRVAADGALTLDSVGPTGDYLTEMGGRVRSNIRPEALSVSSRVGLALAANEGEGTITLLGASAASFRACE